MWIPSLGMSLCCDTRFCKSALCFPLPESYIMFYACEISVYSIQHNWKIVSSFH